MKLLRLHRRLTVLMGMASLAAFAGGAGFEPLSAGLAGAALVIALFWQASESLSVTMERIWMPLAALLVLRALWHVFFVRGDVVIPVVDLLLLLMAAESLRSLEAPNDARLYALSFALLLASTAYRPGILFGIAFVAYLGLATVALMVGHLIRAARHHHEAEPTVGRGFLTATAALSGVTLTMSVVVFVTFPRVSRGWAGRGEAPMTSIAGFSDEVALGTHGSRIYPNPRIVLRVEFPDGAPDDMAALHWRGRSYDHFDGLRWSRSDRLPPSTAPPSWYRERWPGARRRQEIYATPLDVKVLFALHPVVDIDADSRIQPIFDNAGDFVYWGSASPVYTASSVAGTPSADELRQATSGFTPARPFYTQLPPLDPRIPELADSLVGGLDNAYDKAAALEDWFHREFSYTLELPATASGATLESFLFRRRAGHCEYFSTAMVVLLRLQGVPAREVNGFLGGQWNEFGQYLAVTQNEAHSWVEAWFPGYGWVPFDPTPPGAGTGEASRSSFWFGRFLMDGLQHRWSKWVLDYSLTSQGDLLAGLSELFGRDDASVTGSADAGSEGLGGWGVAGLALAGILGLAWLAYRLRTRRTPQARLYLKLRKLYRKKGLPDAESLPPLAFLERAREDRLPGVDAARRVVELYLGARFGREEVEASRLEEMSRALGGARRALRGRG